MEILYENPNEDIFKRLLKIRNIEGDIENFLNPTFGNSWIDPYLLNDFDIAINRIEEGIQKNEKIIIFGDYDVDGITASFLLYKFFRKFLNYKNISIRLPNRLEDGYGIKDKHLDEMKNIGANLVITVDNGITAIKEAEYANKIGLDLIITDHHKALEDIPKAIAIVNPQISPNYSFKGIAGVGVAFKIITAFINKYFKNQKEKKYILDYLLPIVAIGTVADCVPLLGENRLMTKLGLEAINSNKTIPKSISNFIKYLNITSKLDTFHIGFMLAPRINAGGRMQSPYDSLNCLLSTGEKQKQHLDNLEKLNTLRRKTQEEGFKEIDSLINHEKKVLIAQSEKLHEGIVGIAAGRITEKYNKPSVILTIKKEEGIAVGSLRGPEYFSVIEMLNYAGKYLERFGGHKQAGGMTVKIENLEIVKELFFEFGEKNVKDENTNKKIVIDTNIYPNEIKNGQTNNIEKLAPFGEGNPEPIFLLENIIYENVEKVGKNGKGHLKAHANIEGIKFPVMFWGKGDQLDFLDLKNPTKLVGKVKKDTYNGGFFIDGVANP